MEKAIVLQSCLKLTGKAIFLISLLTSGVRVAKSIYDEITIDDEIQSLEQIVRILAEDLADQNLVSQRREDTKDALKFSKELLNQALVDKNHPGKKTLDTILCVSGEYTGAAIGGLIGAKIGTEIGLMGGPVGAISGAVIGSVLGATVGSTGGRLLVKKLV